MKKNTFDDIFASFNIGKMEVALNVKSVQEVVNYPANIIKMPLAPDFLVGVFNLRGLIIPVINLKDLLSLEERNIDPLQKVAIVDFEGAKIGMLFDSTNEILRVKNEQIDHFNYVDEKSHGVVAGALRLDHGERIIQVLNPSALFNIENIPQILGQQQKRLIEKSHAYQEGKKKCISFSVKGIKLGFEIAGINEIIKVTAIEASAITDELCLGIINIRGQIVPVIDTALLLGVPPSSLESIHEKRIVVLKLEKEMFGLLVDGVENIIPFQTEAIMAIPLLNKKRAEMFTGCILDQDQKEIFLLNHTHMLSNQEVNAITLGHSKFYQSEVKTQVEQERRNCNSYISFKLDQMFAVSIHDVREIISNTDEIIAAPGATSVIKGILNLRGRLVTIINTRSLYQLPDDNSSDSKILIFDQGAERFGFIVDSIDSIVTVDEEKKRKVPSLMVQNVKEKFSNDIKEIVTINQNEKESVMIILNIEPVIARIKGLAA